MKVYPDLMEPMFNYLGHGSSKHLNVPNLPQVLQVDVPRTRDVGALPQ